MPHRVRLGQFTDPDAVLSNLEGTGEHGDLGAQLTHEGLVVSGSVPRSQLPPHMLVGQEQQQQRQQQQQQDSQMTTFTRLHDSEQQQASEDHPEQEPSRSLSWLHKIVDDFYEFRTRQFDVKRGGGALKYLINDDTDRTMRMIVPSPITDDVAFFLFEMISERYGVPAVIAAQCEGVLRAAKFYAHRDVAAGLFFTLLHTPSFDSNDVRFVCEARRQMRSSLVSQRGVDGITRWFIPLRIVPHVIRKTCDHPWARPVYAKVHSAFERLLHEQHYKNGGDGGAGPLFTMPSPQNLSLVPPYADDHPLVGRGPYVDIRGSEAFLAAQPHQLVIGADYLLCMLFVNWVDHREIVVQDSAEGRPIRSVVNRRRGIVSDAIAVSKDDATEISKLAMFAMDVADEVDARSSPPSMSSSSAAAAAGGSFDAEQGSSEVGPPLEATLQRQRSGVVVGASPGPRRSSMAAPAAGGFKPGSTFKVAQAVAKFRQGGRGQHHQQSFSGGSRRVSIPAREGSFMIQQTLEEQRQQRVADAQTAKKNNATTSSSAPMPPARILHLFTQ